MIQAYTPSTLQVEQPAKFESVQCNSLESLILRGSKSLEVLAQDLPNFH